MNRKKDITQPMFLQKRKKQRQELMKKTKDLQQKKKQKKNLQLKGNVAEKKKGNVLKKLLPFKNKRSKFLMLSIVFMLLFAGIGAVEVIQGTNNHQTQADEEMSIIKDVIDYHKEKGTYKKEDVKYIIGSPLLVEDIISSETWSKSSYNKGAKGMEVSFDRVIVNEYGKLVTTHDFIQHDKMRMTFNLNEVKKVDMVKYNYSSDPYYDDAPERFEYAIGELHEYPAIDLSSKDEKVQDIKKRLEKIGYPMGVLSQKEEEERTKEFRELHNVIEGKKEFKNITLELSEHNVYKVTGGNKFPRKDVGNKQVNKISNS